MSLERNITDGLATIDLNRAGVDPLDDEERGLTIAQCHVEPRNSDEQPIIRLAPEILSQIFMLLDALQFVENVEDTLTADAHKRKSLLRLCEVCVRWRRVCLSTPHLWNHILIRRPSDPFALRCLTLSRTLPLVLYYFENPSPKEGDDEASETEEPEAIEVAMKHSHRLRELLIYGAWHESNRFWKTLQCEAPELKVFKLLASGELYFQSPTVPQLFLGSAPSLVHLQMSIFSPLPGTCQFRNLRSLALHDQDVRDVMTMGFSRFLCVLELSPQLEELVISRSGPSHDVPDVEAPLPGLSDNPVVLPNLQSLSLGCWLESTENVVTFLSYLRIPDSAARHVFASSACDWDADIVDFIQEGRLDGSPPIRSIRKLRMISSSLIEGHFGLSLEDDTLTFTSNIDLDICAILYTSGLLSDVQSFVMVESSRYPIPHRGLNFLFKNLPSLRSLTISGVPKAIIPWVVRAFQLLPSKPMSLAALLEAEAPPCPLLDTIAFLDFSIVGHWGADSPRSDGGVGQPISEEQVDGTLISRLAEDRAKRGCPLRRVVVERCEEQHLRLIAKCVKDVISVYRGVDWPLGHFERSILRDELKRTKGPGVKKHLTDL